MNRNIFLKELKEIIMKRKNEYNNVISKIKNNYFDIDYFKELSIKFRKKKYFLKNISQIFFKGINIELVPDEKKYFNIIFLSLKNKNFNIEKNKDRILIKKVELSYSEIIEEINNYKNKTILRNKVIFKKIKEKLTILKKNKTISENEEIVLKKILTSSIKEFNQNILSS
ncbi:hypothetical protein [Candidatus Vidania fulgoroideorum]